MLNLSLNLLILFGISAAAAIGIPATQGHVLKQLSTARFMAGIAKFALVLLGVGVAVGLTAILGGAIQLTLPTLIVSALLAFCLAKVNLPAPIRGVILLAATVVFSIMIPAGDAAQMLSAAVAGLVVFKLTDHLLLEGEQTLDDVLPPLVWLAGVCYFATAGTGPTVTKQANALLGIISVCLLLRTIHTPFMSDDKWLVKRVVLATTGGLGVLLVITKLMLALDMAHLALLVGAGIFATYLFKDSDADGAHKVSSTSGVKLLIVIGMLAMIATRFWGMFGLLALAPTALVAPRSGFAQYIGLYCAVRAMLQVFIGTYNSNVTGINVTHSYVGAAMYAGFIVIAVLALLMRDFKEKKILIALFLGAGVVVPMVADYYLHAEPTSSFLVSATMAAVMLAALGPAFSRDETVGYENLMLMPALMVSMGTIGGALIELGNNAPNDAKAKTLAFVVAGIALLIAGASLVRKNMNKKAVAATEP